MVEIETVEMEMLEMVEMEMVEMEMLEMVEMVERQASSMEEDNSVLGLIHLDLAKYHETNR